MGRNVEWPLHHVAEIIKQLTTNSFLSLFVGRNFRKRQEHQAFSMGEQGCRTVFIPMVCGVNGAQNDTSIIFGENANIWRIFTPFLEFSNCIL